MEPKDYIAVIRAHGLSQAQIAARTGITQPTISKIERGDVADVMSRNYRALQALAQELAQPHTARAQPATESVANTNKGV